MRRTQPYSLLVIILISIYFGIKFQPKIELILKDKNTCICEYDGFGYYIYLPYLFEQGSLNVKKEWAQELQNDYCSGNDVYQIINYKGRGEINIYHLGLAYLQLPAYSIAHIFAKTMDFETNGMSKPFHIAYILNALLFIFLGLLYLRKLLLLFIKDQASALAILAVFLASNVSVVFEHQYQLPHLYLFALNSAFLYYLVLYFRNENKNHLILSAIILGLSFVIRPTQAYLGLIPTILFYQKYGFTKVFRNRILVFPIFAILIDLPQLIYWTYSIGNPFAFNLHTQDMALTDPNLIDFLFSYKKGWLLYSPFFLLLIPAFWRLKSENKKLFNALLFSSIIYIYVVSSWTCWWYAASYSSRVMADIYPFFILCIGVFLQSLKSVYSKIGIFIFSILTITLNQIQIDQSNKTYLHHSRMTKEHYWYIFGKQHIVNYNDSLLEISRLDTSWVNNKSIIESDAFKIEKKIILNLKDITAKSDTKEEFKIIEMPILTQLKTDETLIEIELESKSTNNKSNVTFHVRTESKRSTYDWQSLEISKGFPENQSSKHKLKFNLPRIRNNDDYFRIFLRLPGDTNIEIEELTIKATSLIRK